MNDMITWLRDAITQREESAHAAIQETGDWHTEVAREDPDDSNRACVRSRRGEVITGDIATECAEHIALNDPADVLRRCAADRKLLDAYAPAESEPETDAQLHARFAHPAWEYRATSGPRKQWDDADLPPCDQEGDPEPGWERNTDAGRDGWDRFDYTEESYWRRRRPEGQQRKPYVPDTIRFLAEGYGWTSEHPES